MNAVLRKSLTWGVIFAVVLLVVAGAIGWFVAGEQGVVSAAIGAAVAAIFMGLTAASLLIVDRANAGRPSIVAVAGTVVGVFLVKMVLFVILMIWLQTQDWLAPGVFGVTVVVAVVGTLGIDIAAMATTRVPIVEIRPPAGDARGD
ncbi:MAG TPA: hypothetical protein VNQ52_05145 [Microbacteriaceae bacterium]|nr:hypothetical protein [Microbacteriaceae bacterium]